MTQPIADTTNRWPPLRRAAWVALYVAILSWSAMVDPTGGVRLEPLPLEGWVGA